MKDSHRTFSNVLLWLLILSLSLTGCAAKEPLKTYESHDAHTETSDLNAVQTQFEDFTYDLFRDSVTENTINLHYSVQNPEAFDIHEYPLTLGTWSQKQIDDNAAQADSLLSKLHAFNRDDLTFEQQLTFDILENDLVLNSRQDDFPYYEEVLKPSIGVQTELPTLLAEYTFLNEQDVLDYLALLGDMEAYFKQLLVYEQEKADAGLFMSDACADLVIADCNSFLNDTEEHFLIATFEERLSALSSISNEQKEIYRRQNHTLVTEHLRRAFTLLRDGISDLKGKGTNEGGLSNYPKGKEYYEYLLKSATGSDRPVKELEKMTINQINEDFKAIQAILSEKPELSSKISEFAFSLTEPEEIVKDLQAKMLSDFPPLETEIHLSIKNVSKSMEDALSPAFYLTPPVDNLIDNVIYINGGSLDASDLYSTLAHEGYPGHLYQTVYSTHCCDNPVRQLCSVGGFSEGWATYVENLSYQYDTGIDADLASLMQHNNSANLGLYALLDFYIHYDGWTLSQVDEWVQNYYHIDSEEAVSELYHTIVSQPCNYLKYYVGYLEFMELRNEAEQTLGNDFNLKEFHTFLLEIGEAPFYIIRDYMKAWMKTM